MGAGTNTGTGGSVLDLDAVEPPLAPSAVRWEVISVRLRPYVVAWLRERALAEATTVNRLVVRLIDRERAGGLPADCRGWLARQAAQCGVPGEIDQALVLVIRHLAARWPDGGRLNV